MLLRKIRIQNFRGIHDLTVDFGRTTVLIGENNSGKTTLLDALRLSLSRNVTRKGGAAFDDYDYHLSDKTSEPHTADPITITLSFTAAEGEQLEPEFRQAIGDTIVFDQNNREWINFRVRSGYDTPSKQFITDWHFLDPNGNELGSKTKRPQILADLLRYFPVFYLSAFRDAVREFKTGSFWTPFIRNPVLTDKQREDLQDQIDALNKEVLKSHASLQAVKTNLGKIKSIVPVATTDAVDIEALPGRIADLLSGTQVSVKTPTGAAIPLSRHGAGTQSLSVLFLFEAFLSTMLDQQYDPLSSPLLALEEPESHLHPAAIRCLWPLLEALGGQKVIATHSGDLLARAPLTAIRRLHSPGAQTQVGSIPATLLDAEEDRKIRFHLATSRGELMFAKCWLLGEGESEHWAFYGVAEQRKIDLDQHGIRFIGYRESGHQCLLKVANSLGIPWLLLADGDQQGANTLKTAKLHLQGRKEGDHLFRLPHSNIEFFLCENGYGSVFEAHISPQKKKKVVAKKGDPDYWPQVLDALDNTPKPTIVQEVIQSMTHAIVPKLLSDCIDQAITLAKG